MLSILRNQQLIISDTTLFMLPLQPDSSYHIFNHANGFEDLFRCEGNYWFFLQKYQLYIEPIAETYAYCLMPNHFHLVIRIRKREVIEGLVANNFPKVSNFGKVIGDREIEKYLSKQFANLFSCYTQSFNKVYNRMGSLFIKNFKRELIEDKKYFLTTVAYVHRNPIHHGFCRTYEEWPYSSYRQITEGIKSDLRTESEKLMKMTLGLDEFIKLHRQSLRIILDDIIADDSTTA